MRRTVGLLAGAALAMSCAPEEGQVTVQEEPEAGQAVEAPPEEGPDPSEETSSPDDIPISADMGERQWEAAVAALEARVAGEDGWLVVHLPVMHEGGGLQTLWLHPCDEGRDETRTVTDTSAHGSDIQGEPGWFVVEQRYAPCVTPGRGMAGGFEVDFDIIAIDNRTYAILDDTPLHNDNDVNVTFPDGTEVAVAPHTFHIRPDEPCDGPEAPAMTRRGPELVPTTIECTGSFAALPTEALNIISYARHSPLHNLNSGRAPENDVDALRAAFDTAGWDEESIRTSTFEGTTFEPAWQSPCIDGSATLLSWFDGHVQSSARTC